MQFSTSEAFFHLSGFGGDGDMVVRHEAALHTFNVSRHIVVLTGAGVSAESGIPTFRDAMSGLWAQFDPSQLATPEAFARDPALVTRWYDARRCQLSACRPNAGHMALAELEHLCVREGKRFTLITQNVDRLHQAAGSTNVIELHGTLATWRCMSCGVETDEQGPAFQDYPPRCGCGGKKRPGVVWFGEALPPDALSRAKQAARSCDLFVSVGTSSVVYPAASLLDLALQRRAKLLEINPEPTPYTNRAAWSIRKPSGEALPGLIAMLRDNIATTISQRRH